MQKPERREQAGPSLDVGELFREHAAFVGRCIRRLTGEGAHVDDLLQDVFLIAIRKRNQFAGKSKVETWLYGIAANLCMRHHRSLRRRMAFRDRLRQQPEPSQVPTPDLDHERKQQLAAVSAALSKLPFKQREVVVLYELEGRNGAEIAELVNVPIGTVWARLARGRERFAKLMRQQGVGERHGA